MKFLEIILFVNWTIFLGVLLYSLYWTVRAISTGTWQAANQQTVSRERFPKRFWFGVALMLGVSIGLFAINSALVVYRQSLFEFFFGRS